MAPVVTSGKGLGKAAAKATGQPEEVVGSERDKVASQAAGGLAVLAAVANEAPGSTSKSTSTLVEEEQVIVPGKGSLSGIEGPDRSPSRTGSGSAEASIGDGTVAFGEKGGSEGKPGGEVSTAGARERQSTPEDLVAEGGTVRVKDPPCDEPSSVVEGRSSEASTARAEEEGVSGDNAVQGAKNSTATSTVARPGEASAGDRGRDDSSPGDVIAARVEEVAKTEKQGSTNGAQVKEKTQPKLSAETEDVEMTDVAPADKNVVKPKEEETSSAENEMKALVKRSRTGASGVVAPRGMVRRDGDSGAACRMCRSKWDRDQTLVCSECLMHYHPGCLDPPMTPKEVNERVTLSYFPVNFHKKL